MTKQKILICTTPNRGLCELTENKQYEYVKVERGIFETDPYVTVKELDSNKTITCHFYRFFDDKQFLKDEYKKMIDQEQEND